ncbi:MAG: dephospho-CoA kinase [Bernardetiaceae bacterium]
MSYSRPLRIGLTGGIGAGKSTVARIFAVLGIPIYLADDRAKWLTANDLFIKQQVVHHFGTAAYLPDGSPNRAYLSEQVFTDPARAKQLESWVHPAVRRDFEQWAAAHEQAPYLLKEAALLFEANTARELDRIIVVAAPEELRIARVLARDPHRDQAQVRAILDKQIPQAQKIAQADFVIHNDGQQHLILQVLKIHQQIQNL